MGWVDDDGTHEGWAAPVAQDGRESHGSGMGGQMMKGLTGNYPRYDPLLDYELVPEDEIIGWRAYCTCGWAGALWHREIEPGSADHGRSTPLPLGEPADAPPGVESVLHREWRTHLAPVLAIASVRDAAAALAKASRSLDEAVERAKGAGASWADIGQATGISRQSAHERWAKHSL